MDLLNSIKLFFKGALIDSATDKLEVTAEELNDALLTVILSERIGVPDPMYYYLVETLPYLANDMEGWNRRMADRKSVIAKVTGEVGEP